MSSNNDVQLAIVTYIKQYIKKINWQRVIKFPLPIPLQIYST